MELVLQRKFYLCIIFRIKGIPYANTTWLKDGKPLVISNEHYKHYTIPTQGAQADGKHSEERKRVRERILAQTARSSLFLGGV